MLQLIFLCAISLFFNYSTAYEVWGEAEVTDDATVRNSRLDALIPFNVTTPEWKGDLVHGGFIVDRRRNTFQMVIYMPKSFEWIGFHLVNIQSNPAARQRRPSPSKPEGGYSSRSGQHPSSRSRDSRPDNFESAECFRTNGDRCTEGYDFAFDARGFMSVRFQHIRKFVLASQVPDQSGTAADCNREQIDEEFCREGETVISGGPVAFVVERIPFDEGDYKLVSIRNTTMFRTDNGYESDYYEIRWNRSLEAPLDGSMGMMRMAAKPWAYNARGYKALELAYHGPGVSQTTMIPLQ
eukprot:Filipodium_phascolosomae@DN1075_c0_g1_i1.p1